MAVCPVDVAHHSIPFERLCLVAVQSKIGYCLRLCVYHSLKSEMVEYSITAERSVAMEERGDLELIRRKVVLAVGYYILLHPGAVNACSACMDNCSYKHGKRMREEKRVAGNGRSYAGS